jgi:hypothetical protein
MFSKQGLSINISIPVYTSESTRPSENTSNIRGREGARKKGNICGLEEYNSDDN